MKVLNLYAGLGGNRKLWPEGCQVTAVESNPKVAAAYSRMFPGDRVLLYDAFDFLLKYHRDYTFIWSSPPCQSHSKMARATRHKVHPVPDPQLSAQIKFLSNNAKALWVVENVRPYYTPEIPWNAEIDRHVFWSNFDISSKFVPPPKPRDFINRCNLAGRKAMLEWLGMDMPEVIYMPGNHCPAQVLRNCVHPLLGRHVFDAAMASSTLEHALASPGPDAGK